MKKKNTYRKKSHQPKTDIYQLITDKIVSALKAGVGPWIKPWDDSKVAFGLHRNGNSDRPYRGINVLLLNLVAFEKGYQDPRWVTFNDVQRLGGQIRKGEQHTKIVFWKFREIIGDNTDNEEENSSPKVIPLVRVHRVFNVEQCDRLHLTPLDDYHPNLVNLPANDQAETVLSLPEIRHGGVKAAFYPSRDFIQLPPKNSFESTDHYYATAFHEVIHWSGHESRLKRTFGKRFGDKNYAFEELVAEIGAAFLGAHTNLPFKEMRHPEYIQEWINTLKADKRAIFTACRLSQKATDFILDQLEGKNVLIA